MDFSNVNLDLWKKMQDEFSRSIGLPISSVDTNGNEIVVSGKYPFFYDLLKKENADFVAKTRIMNIPDLHDKDYSLFKYCEGIYGIAFPIKVFSKVIGVMIVDCIKKDSPDFSSISKATGIDKEELEYAYEEIESVREEKIEDIASTAGILARTVPELAYYKQQDDLRISEMTTLSELIKLINSSLDLDSVLKYIMNFMINNLKAIDCSIIVDSEEGQKKYCLKEDAKSLHVVESAIRNRLNETKNYILVEDIDKKFNLKIPEGYNSVVSFPLRMKDEIVGSLNVYGSKVLELGHDDLNFLSTVSSQAAIAVINAAKFEEVKELAVVDKLTGAYNRRYFMSLLEKQLEKKEPVSLILTDVDDFGHYNNTHGHPQGDEVLKKISQIFKSNVRADDMVGRYGGEEFIIMLPGLKSNESAEITKRLKESIENNPFPGGEQQPQGKLTVSLGLVTSLDEKISMKELIKEADDALYKAKKQGKNRFVHTVMIKNNLKADTVVKHK